MMSHITRNEENKTKVASPATTPRGRGGRHVQTERQPRGAGGEGRRTSWRVGRDDQEQASFVRGEALQARKEADDDEAAPRAAGRGGGGWWRRRGERVIGEARRRQEKEKTTQEVRRRWVAENQRARAGSAATSCCCWSSAAFFSILTTLPQELNCCMVLWENMAETMRAKPGRERPTRPWKRAARSSAMGRGQIRGKCGSVSGSPSLSAWRPMSANSTFCLSL
mmetsp:Transcript_2191/g.5592  ORF Transcript_2191/g.5592 Transcript_2191/m.5592 type:complete len:224 (+) Transcript_2191:32-703(+)